MVVKRLIVFCHAFLFYQISTSSSELNGIKPNYNYESFLHRSMRVKVFGGTTKDWSRLAERE